AVGLGWLLLSEHVGGRTLVATAVIVTGVALLVRPVRRPRRYRRRTLPAAAAPGPRAGDAAQAARSRTRSMRRTRSPCVPASGATLSVVTPDSRSAASRSATCEPGPMSEIP